LTIISFYGGLCINEWSGLFLLEALEERLSNASSVRQIEEGGGRGVEGGN